MRTGNEFDSFRNTIIHVPINMQNEPLVGSRLTKITFAVLVYFVYTTVLYNK